MSIRFRLSYDCILVQLAAELPVLTDYFASRLLVEDFVNELWSFEIVDYFFPAVSYPSKDHAYAQGY